MSQPLQSPGTQAATVAHQAREGTSQLWPVGDLQNLSRVEMLDTGWVKNTQQSWKFKQCHVISLDTISFLTRLSWVEYFFPKSCVEHLFEKVEFRYKRFCFHFPSPWKISSCRCLLSPFIARSLGRTCRFRRSSHREPVVVAGQGILPRKGTNIPWKWIIGRWNGPWKWIGRWNGKYPLEDEISFWNGPCFWWGHVNFLGGISDIEMKFWRLDFISHLEYSHVSRTNWRLDVDEFLMFNDMMSIPHINGKMGPCITLKKKHGLIVSTFTSHLQSNKIQQLGPSTASAKFLVHLPMRLQ